MSRLRPRFSLQTTLSMMTIVGMAITIAILWREIGPQRAELRAKRQELGQLSIEDPTRGHVVQVPTKERDVWKWRLYLPQGADYRLMCYSGVFSAPKDFHTEDWFAGIVRDGQGWSLNRIDGEFTLGARIAQPDGRWQLITSSTKRDDQATNIYRFDDDWLSDQRRRSVFSHAGLGDQTTFKIGGPVVLLHVSNPVLTENPGGGYSKRDPDGPAESVVLWIEPAK